MDSINFFDPQKATFKSTEQYRTSQESFASRPKEPIDSEDSEDDDLPSIRTLLSTARIRPQCSEEGLLPDTLTAGSFTDPIELDDSETNSNSEHNNDMEEDGAHHGDPDASNSLDNFQNKTSCTEQTWRLDSGNHALTAGIGDASSHEEDIVPPAETIINSSRNETFRNQVPVSGDLRDDEDDAAADGKDSTMFNNVHPMKTPPSQLKRKRVQKTTRAPRPTTQVTPAIPHSSPNFDQMCYQEHFGNHLCHPCVEHSDHFAGKERSQCEKGRDMLSGSFPYASYLPPAHCACEDARLSALEFPQLPYQFQPMHGIPQIVFIPYPQIGLTQPCRPEQCHNKIETDSTSKRSKVAVNHSERPSKEATVSKQTKTVAVKKCRQRISKPRTQLVAKETTEAQPLRKSQRGRVLKPRQWYKD